MSTVTLYESEAEMQRHRRAIQMLARETGLSVEDVSPLYERELERLKEYATVKDFLTVFASRRVKEKLYFKRIT